MKKFDVIVVTRIAQFFVGPHTSAGAFSLPRAPLGTVSATLPAPFFGVTSLLLAPPSGAQSAGPLSGRPSFAQTATFSVVSLRGNPANRTVTFSPPAYGPPATTETDGRTELAIALAGPDPRLFTAMTRAW